MTTKIIIDLFNGKNEHISRYVINDTIKNNDDIDIDEILYNKDGSIQHKSKMNGADDELIIDQYFSNTSNVVGEYSKINIESLSDPDLTMFNKLFLNNYEIPDCVDLKVSPNVKLTNLPKINSNPEKDTCPICLEELYNEPVSYISGNKGNVQYCNHKFHSKCIQTYCSKNEECLCPLCRKKIEYGDIKQLGGMNDKRPPKSIEDIMSLNRENSNIFKRRPLPPKSLPNMDNNAIIQKALNKINNRQNITQNSSQPISDARYPELNYGGKKRKSKKSKKNRKYAKKNRTHTKKNRTRSKTNRK